MAENKDRRNGKDRRDTTNKRSEKFIKYFLPDEDERRNGKDRRKSNL